MTEMPGRNPRRGKEGSENAWNLKEIRELIDVLIDREITEFEMEKGGVRVHIKRGSTSETAPGPNAPPATFPVSTPVYPSSPPPAPGVEPSSPVAAPMEAPPPESTEGLYIIKSPIVGTYYEAPGPSAPPFVTPGDVVQVGQVLCIIEAMKLMNEIESEVAGEIVRIYVENGQPVEYGESLFAIKPSHKK
jgi:acetyl-CoA carboxylase biotin carboxyl carrier protein